MKKILIWFLICPLIYFLSGLNTVFGQLRIEKTDCSCGKNDDGTAEAIVEGVTAIFIYSWHFKESEGIEWGNTKKITGLEPGKYFVNVKKEGQPECEAEASCVIKREGGISVSISMLEYGPNHNAPRRFIARGYGGKPLGQPPHPWPKDYHYKWNTGETTAEIQAVAGKEYSVTVTDASGCVGVTNASFGIIQIARGIDPNDIIGPQGYSEEQWVSKNIDMPYTIHFENDPELATAPALKVIVTMPVDEHTNMYSLQLSDFGFANLNFTLPQGSTFYQQRLDVRDSLGVFVDVIAGLNVNTHEAFWIFESIDPATGLPPDDPGMGFLPINDTVTHRGEGFVTFSLHPHNSTVTGDSVLAQAKIVFDENEPIWTNTWKNMIDALPPESNVNPVSPVSNTTDISLSFTGQDDPGGTGIDYYKLYVSENEQPFYFYRDYDPDSSALFDGYYDINYRFFSIAVDNVGNVEAMKNEAEASTYVDSTGLYGVHTLTILPGWSGISTYIIPDNTLVEDIFEPVVNDVVILMESNKVYWPAFNINSIVNWDTKKGFKIKTLDTIQVVMAGMMEQDKTLDLPFGWSSIPVLNTSNVSTIDMFSPLGDTLTIVKEIAGPLIYWPAMGVTSLQYLVPGKAYDILVKYDCSVTFPDSRGGGANSNVSFTPPPSWNVLFRTAFSHTVAIDQQVLKTMQKEDVIGAFTSTGLCAGMVQMADQGNGVALTVYGNDPTTLQLRDGFNADDKIFLRLFKGKTGEEYVLEADYDAELPDQGRFRPNGLSRITALNLPEQTATLNPLTVQLALYPNPADGVLNIEYPGIINERIRYEIFSAKGDLITSGEISQNLTSLNISSFNNGLYFIRLSDTEWTGIKKFVVQQSGAPGEE